MENGLWRDNGEEDKEDSVSTTETLLDNNDKGEEEKSSEEK